MSETDKIMMMHNTEAEREVISACVAYENMWEAIAPSMQEDYFTDADCKKAYGIIKQLEKEGKQIEMTEFALRFTSVGGNIAQFVSDKAAGYEITKQRVELLANLAKRRKIYVVCAKGMSIAANPLSDENEFGSLLAEMNTTTEDASVSIQTFGSVLKELRKDMVERKEGRGEQGMMTGLHIFDSHFGWHTGDLIIMAGRTSQGKSTLATTIARNMGLMGIPSAYYSMEMGAKQLTARIMARDTLISSSRMLYDKMNDGELASFDMSASAMDNLPIYFDEKSKTSFGKITTSIRAMVRKYGIKIVFIDYLQILANGSESNREQLIGDMARELKVIAVELNICIVALSQLARAKDKPEPTLMEMRGSGQIEEACDTAILVYRPYVYGIERYKDGTLTYGTAQITIAKGRNIGLAQEVVDFVGDLTYFKDREPDSQPTLHAQGNTWADNDPLPF